eukprot:jgi/Botrbrau1/16874/Bobra.150_2s0093.1
MHLALSNLLSIRSHQAEAAEVKGANNNMGRQGSDPVSALGALDGRVPVKIAGAPRTLVPTWRPPRPSRHPSGTTVSPVTPALVPRTVSPSFKRPRVIALALLAIPFLLL